MKKKIINGILILLAAALIFTACDDGNGNTNNTTTGKAEGGTVSAPTLASKTHNSITVTAPSAPSTGQAIEYGRNTENTAPASWQDGTSFTGLSDGTTYYIFARAKENATHNAGTPSTGLEVTTDLDSNIVSSGIVYHRDCTFSNGVYSNVGGSNYNEIIIVFNKHFSAMDVVIDVESPAIALNFYLRDTTIGMGQDRIINWNSSNDYGTVAKAEGRSSWPVILNPLAKKANCVIINCGGELVSVKIKSITIGGRAIPLTEEGTPVSEYRYTGPAEDMAPPPVCSCAGCTITNCGCGVDCEHGNCWKCPVCDPPPTVSINMRGTVTQAQMTVLYGDYSPITNGYRVEWTYNFGYHWTAFKVDLGIFSVSDISSIEFDLKTVRLNGANNGDGKIMIRAQTDPLSGQDDPMYGWIISDSEVLATVVSERGADINATGVANQSVTGSGYGLYIDDDTNFYSYTIDIDPTTPNASLTGEVWFSIYIHAEWNTEIEVTNIKLN